jgi:hypothetical protein
LSRYLSLEDLFLAGLAFDIVGAFLLARGLLLSNRQIFWLAGTNKGLSQLAVPDRCQNKALGIFGVAYLSIGFFFQGIGYALETRGDGFATGPTRFLAGIGIAAFAILLAAVGWLVFGGRLTKRIEAAVAAERPKAEDEERLSSIDDP